MYVYTVEQNDGTFTARCDLCEWAGRGEGYAGYGVARSVAERHYRGKHHRDVMRQIIRGKMENATVTWREAYVRR